MILFEVYKGTVDGKPSIRIEAEEHRDGLPLTIKLARILKGLSQAEVAKRMGVSQQQVTKLESKKSNPTVNTVRDVANAIGVLILVTWNAEKAQSR